MPPAGTLSGIILKSSPLVPLALELRPGSQRESRVGTRHRDAHQAYLKGRYHWNRPGADGVSQAVSYFEEALALDPGFAAAHAALGRAYVTAAEYYCSESRQALESGRAAACRALNLNRTESDAHVTLGDAPVLLEHSGRSCRRGGPATVRAIAAVGREASATPALKAIV
jgi:hypothetical protein